MTQSSNARILLRLKPGVSKKKAQEVFPTLKESLTGKSLRNWERLTLPDSVALSAEYAVLAYTDVEDGEEIAVSAVVDENIFPFTVLEDGPLTQSVSVDEASESTIGSVLWQLPCREFEGLWESLIFDDDIKRHLLSYLLAALELSSRGVDSTVVSINRLSLLIGPPGTGKTTLCHALAQQLSILMSRRFPRCSFIEVNSHSLFSKWFSESGKLVGRLFEQVEEVAEDEGSLVFLLLDEAESLAASRSISSRRGEPADSIRAVNALLTQIDRLRRRPNVFILCTSNLVECLDRALLDRADICRRLPLPSAAVFSSLFMAAFHEFARVGVILGLPPDSEMKKATMELGALAKGMSARAARKVAVVALSLSSKNELSFEEATFFFSVAIQSRQAKLSIDEV